MPELLYQYYQYKFRSW